MPRKFKTQPSSGRAILLVDDNSEYLSATGILLEREGRQILRASFIQDFIFI